MIEDMMICKFVAQHQTMHLQESNADPGILENDCGQVALIASDPGSRRKHSYKCGDGLDEQFETVSAQIAWGLFRSPVIGLPHEIQISSRGSRLNCVVCHFCYGQAIESTGAAKH
jgi:hypothetical protein